MTDDSGTDQHLTSWDVVVSYVGADHGWAEWITWQLLDAGYRAFASPLVTGGPAGPKPDSVTAGARSAYQLVVVSSAFPAELPPATLPASGPGGGLVTVRVGDCSRPASLAHGVSFDLFGLAPAVAREWLVKQVAVSCGPPSAAVEAPPPPPPRAAAAPPLTTPPAGDAANSGSAARRPEASALAEPREAPTQTTQTGHRGQTAVMAGHKGAVRAVAFRADGRLLATAGNDSSVSLWDLASPEKAHRVVKVEYGRRWNQEWVRSVAFSPAGSGSPNLLAAGGDGATVLLWDTTHPAQPVELAQLTGHAGYVYGLAFSPDGKLLATSGVDRGVLVTDVSDPGQPVKVTAFLAHRAPVNGVVFDPYQTTLATAGDDGTVIVWDLAGGDSGPKGAPVPTALATLAAHRGSVHALAFSPDGRLLATAGKDGNVVVWDVTAGAQPARAAVLTGHRKSVNALAFSPDGTLLATGGKDKTVLLWEFTSPDDVAGARTSATLTGHRSEVRSTAFSPDGTRLATGGDDGTAVLWTVR